MARLKTTAPASIPGGVNASRLRNGSGDDGGRSDDREHAGEPSDSGRAARIVAARDGKPGRPNATSSHSAESCVMPPTTTTTASVKVVAVNYDVIIVGCGPVGAFAACLLGRYGVNTLVLERDAAPFSAPRAVAMDDEVVRLMGLHSPELVAWLSKHTLKCPIDLRTGPPSDPSSWSIVGPTHPHVVEASGYHDTVFFHQPDFEMHLRGVLASTPGVSVLRGCEVTGIDAPPVPPPTGPRASRRIPTRNITVTGSVGGGPPTQFKCAFLLGADGGSSCVRKALAIPFTGSTFPDQPWLVVDVETDDPAICHAWQCFNFICSPSRPLVHVPLPGARGGRRFEFMLHPEEDGAHMATPACVRALLAAIGVEESTVRVVRVAVYTFHARVAQQWRVGNVALVGDAAHCMPPFRGQGMCAGLRDAASACWRIAAAQLNVVDPEPVLSTYQVERVGHLQAVTRTAVQMGRLITIRNKWLAALRNVVVGGLYRCPLTQPFFKQPFAPPSSLNAGLFDFHSSFGLRTRDSMLLSVTRSLLQEASGEGEGGVPSGADDDALPNWLSRDRVTGTQIPNYPLEVYVHSANSPAAVAAAAGTGAGSSGSGLEASVVAQQASSTTTSTKASRVTTNGTTNTTTSSHTYPPAVGFRGLLLDEVLTPCLALTTRGFHPTQLPPQWYVLLSPRSSCGESRHLMATLPPLMMDLLCHAEKGLGSLVVQLLPPCGSYSRILAHARARVGAEKPSLPHHPISDYWYRHVSKEGVSSTSVNKDAKEVVSTISAATAVSGSQAPSAPSNTTASTGLHASESPDTSCTSAVGGGGSEPWHPLVHLAVSDVGSKFQAWFDAHACDVVIVRPDRFIFGAYTNKEFAGAVVDLLARLNAMPVSTGSNGESGGRLDAMLPPPSSTYTRTRPTYALSAILNALTSPLLCGAAALVVVLILTRLMVRA